MIKRDEISDPTSCLNIARDDERVFVLLARDVAAPAAIRHWCAERIRLRKNLDDDPQILEAMDCAEKMEAESRGRALERFEKFVAESIGGASMCWENPSGAGVFDSERAISIVKAIVAEARKL